MSANPKLQPRLVATLATAAVAAVGFGACGTQGIQLSKSSRYYNGAALFLQRCSGCHTLSVVGAEGSATSIKDRVRTNGPNFDFRTEQYDQVLYAIRNGGFSGAIMPQNIVLGVQAEEVAAFLAKYAGLQAPKVPSIESTAIPGSSESSTTTTGGSTSAAKPATSTSASARVVAASAVSHSASAATASAASSGKHATK